MLDLSRMLERSFRDSNALDREALCVAPGSRVGGGGDECSGYCVLFCCMRYWVRAHWVELGVEFGLELCYKTIASQISSAVLRLEESFTPIPVSPYSAYC